MDLALDLSLHDEPAPHRVDTSAHSTSAVDGLVSLQVALFHDLADVESVWRRLALAGMESPGQCVDFIAHWVKTQAIPAREQCYVVAELDGMPVALLALHVRRACGVRMASWFPGSHAGCYAPLVDHARLAALTPAERRVFWTRMAAQVPGVDLFSLRTVPEIAGGHAGLFDELFYPVASDTLYRAQYRDWATADACRSRSRRKHDRQQGDRLDALGVVSFESLAGTPEAEPILDVMFAQRAARFRTMGVRDPFACPGIREFYIGALRPGSGMRVVLHVLRLEGEIVAVRYNLAQGDRLFCLISSMSQEPSVQGGSPGKQCLLRVMQTVFDQGYVMFDMGAGFTDEKRHWCNVQIPLRHHFLAVTATGRLALALHRRLQALRARIKGDPNLHRLVKSWRAGVQRLLPGSGKINRPPESVSE